MVRALFLLAALLLVTSACAAPKGETAAAPRQDKDSLQLIAEAAQQGTIDGDTAVLYRVYAVVDPSRLPPEYRSIRALKDGTPILRDARARYDSLRPETQAALRPYLFPRQP